ncbi:hypothetical protein SAMN04515668_0742 [Hymenobacter arizonensis]|uniref:Uncharacterized protein n=2 Tax=Hymenobacter arizonensis TaxID=1227077 RepID=A0A1I5U3E8_HYMAR|nr:hypothetical protein SAMN04515668_0742 [Hymenobacter arizonensis]
MGLAALSVTGLTLVRHKHVASEANLAALKRENISAIDRFSAGYYSETAQSTSDALYYGTVALVPALLAFAPRCTAAMARWLASTWKRCAPRLPYRP